jgi:hypothetical protein
MDMKLFSVFGVLEYFGEVGRFYETDRMRAKELGFLYVDIVRYLSSESFTPFTT